MKSQRIFLVGTGVGRDLRGFESHILDLYEHLKKETKFDVYLVKGAGQRTVREIPVINASRKSRLSEFAGSLFNRNPYDIHQLSFFIGLLPHLLRHKPAALYLGEPGLFNYLYRWREFSGMNFSMIFYTGGNTVPLKMRPDDLLQLVTPVLMPIAEQRGISVNQTRAIPHFINSRKESGRPVDKSALRLKLGIPGDRLVILSVGAIDSSVKRMDYLVEEVSHLTRPYFLMMLGESERETASIKELALRKLGKDNFLISKVDRKELTSYYQAADIFVLASLSEGFALVTIEAMSEGLPVIVHNHEVAHYVLGEMAFYSDLSQRGNLAQSIEQLIPSMNDQVLSSQRKDYAASRFSWNFLKKNYLQMFTDVIDHRIKK